MVHPGKMKCSNDPAAAILYEAVRGGDEVAFAHYYENSYDRLVMLVRRIVKDEEEAKNIVSDTFARLWQLREHIDHVELLDGFVSTSATNSALDFLRKTSVRARYRNEQLYLRDGEEFAADAGMLASEVEMLAKEAIAKMPAQRRRVYELSRDENLTYNEIAERLGISYNTVMFHMKAALQDIRSVITTCLLLWLLD
jgi:RNA polymerase sigma-70 factor (ECF subfamily)